MVVGDPVSIAKLSQRAQLRRWKVGMNRPSSTISNFYETTTRGPLFCPSQTHTHSTDEGKAVSDSRCGVTDGMARFAGVEVLALLSIVVGQRRVEGTQDPKYEFGTANERKAKGYGCRSRNAHITST